MQLQGGQNELTYSGHKAVKKYRAGNITAAFGADLLVTGATSIPNLLLRYYAKMGISDSEMILLIQLFRLRIEENNLLPKATELSACVNASLEQVQQMLKNLLAKGIIAVVEYYDYGHNAVVEGIDFEPLYEKISELWACDKVKDIEQTESILQQNNTNQGQHQEFSGPVLNLCSLFEREFARPLSPMEVDRIKQWSQEADAVLITEALRRAVLLGKSNFRYIDAILLEWRKNNLRTLNDIDRYDSEFHQRRGTNQYKGQKKQNISATGPEKDERKKLYDALLMS